MIELIKERLVCKCGRFRAVERRRELADEMVITYCVVSFIKGERVNLCEVATKSQVETLSKLFAKFSEELSQSSHY